MKNKKFKFIPIAVSLALSVAVFVILILTEEPNMKNIISLMSLALVAQSISLLDFIGEQKEGDSDE